MVERQTPPPIVERPAGQQGIDRQVDAIRHATKAELDRQEKVRLRLAPGPRGKPLPPVAVGINGYNYVIQRGVDVEVPWAVYEQLEQAGQADDDMKPHVVLTKPTSAKK